ncbi:mitochondrial ribonuclease P catalytic subunit-like isoform X2 [Stegodyphus dumicola]|nr:mitochondrial ribonuclease P catalytic subunit-like isoform X2 [Stegodyphus dumicola]XP_035219182.1 mitochondrial ribonuclease P catalytic subunit-like isoform X2 [Stegodyphus dumicola]
MLAILRAQYNILSKRRQLYNIFAVILKNNKEFNFKALWIKSEFSSKYFPAINEGAFSSRYHPGSIFERAEVKIREMLSSKNPSTIEEWEETKGDLMIDINIITESNFSSIVMNSILSLNKLDMADSFMKYLKAVKMTPNFVTYLKYMSVCSRHVEHCQEGVIYKTFQMVKPVIDALPVLDQKSAEHLIDGLCATEHWRLSFDYLKKLPEKPTLHIKNSLACGALRNNDEVFAWEILTKWLRAEESPSDIVFKQSLLYAIKLQKSDPRLANQFIVKLLRYIEEKEVIIKEEVTKLIEVYFKCHSSKWKISYTKVNRETACEACKRFLKPSVLTDEEFTLLKNSFLEKSLKKRDLFINTSHKEFNAFMNFIDHHKPFHIVLDGLNAAYTNPASKKPKYLAIQLLHTVKILAGCSRKLLVLGRNHMKRWPKPIMQKICLRATMFFINDTSQDDPFTVYAALASGPHTLFVSLDLMRDHVSRLEDAKLIHLFKKWQQSHQLFMKVDEENNIKFTEPLRHSINIQGDMERGWHIPFDDNVILDAYEELNNWLCIQKIE